MQVLTSLHVDILPEIVASQMAGISNITESLDFYKNTKFELLIMCCGQDARVHMWLKSLENLQILTKWLQNLHK